MPFKTLHVCKLRASLFLHLQNVTTRAKVKKILKISIKTSFYTFKERRYSIDFLSISSLFLSTVFQ